MIHQRLGRLLGPITVRNFTKPKTRIFDLQPPIAKVSKKVVTLHYSFSSSSTQNQVVLVASEYSVQTLCDTMRYISKLQVGQYPVGSNLQ